jgi:hypothetical protein
VLASPHLSQSTRTLIQQAGTLENGGVYVAAVRRGDLGLFSGRRYEKDSPVVLYGGTLGHSDQFPGDDWGRYVPLNRPYVLSGQSWAAKLRGALSDEWMEQQASLHISLRRHVEPVHNNETVISEVGRGGGGVPDISADLIRSTGIGYMANTSAHCNVKVASHKLRHRCGPDAQLEVHQLGMPVVYYQATTRIEPNTEILAPYNNPFSQGISS